MYRFTPNLSQPPRHSRRVRVNPFRTLSGVPGLGTLYSVYSRPKYSCATAAALTKARDACESAASRGDGFVSEKGLHASKRGTSARPYQVMPGDMTFGPYSVFDPCAIKRLVQCKTQPPPVTAEPPPPPPPVESTPAEVVESEPIEPEYVEPEEEEEPESSNHYVVGGIAALVVGGGLAYYLVTRKKRRRR